jgi:hypothetical protein
MKSIYFIIQNLTQGKKVIWPVDSAVDSEYMREMLMPNEKSFQNDFLEISVEDNKYICLPFTLPE